MPTNIGVQKFKTYNSKIGLLTRNTVSLKVKKKSIQTKLENSLYFL